MPEITLNERKYHFADCPKCGRRRPISPTDGLCWACGQHFSDPQLSAVDPAVKAALADIDRKISEGLSGGIHTDDLIRLINLRLSLEEKL